MTENGDRKREEAIGFAGLKTLLSSPSKVLEDSSKAAATSPSPTPSSAAEDSTKRQPDPMDGKVGQGAEPFSVRAESKSPDRGGGQVPKWGVVSIIVVCIVLVWYVVAMVKESDYSKARRNYYASTPSSNQQGINQLRNYYASAPSSNHKRESTSSVRPSSVARSSHNRLQTSRRRSNATTERIFHVTANTLNVRAGPGTVYPVLNNLSKWDTVTVIEEKMGWLHIKVQGKSGWVSRKYLAE